MKKAKFPFSLSEYKKGIYKVETRDGKPVRILCTDVKRFYPIEALILENSSRENAISYLADGEFGGANNHKNYDLVLVKEIFENGDIIHDNGSLFIVKRQNTLTIDYHVLMDNHDPINRGLIFNGSLVNSLTADREPASHEEKAILSFKLKKFGKCWDPDKKEIVDIKNEKCSFKLKDDVLVRDKDTMEWIYNIFSGCKENSLSHFICLGLTYKQCIPLNDETKHLLGTNQDCPEKYKIW